MAQGHADGGASVELTCAGRAVARYVWDPQLPTAVSPRPYLHPVTTLGGTTVTGFMPEDHLHHLGASIAVPVLNRANFWGGRTYVEGRGSVRLDNHGRQLHARWLHRSADRLVQELWWIGRDGEPLAREERTLAARPVTASSWLLRVEFALRSCTGEALTIDTPGARGRAGAGYGGFFWRAPEGLEGVRAYGDGSNGDVHGSRQPWVVLTGRRPDAEAWTLVFVTGAEDPWFVRSTDYAGVCAAIAWDRPLVVAADGVLSRSLSVLVADGPPTAETAAEAAEADAAARATVVS
jgi:hypothetical protein